MLSLKELEKMTELHDITVKTIECNELRNSLLKEKLKLMEAYENAKKAVERQSARIDDELIPVTKKRILEESPDKKYTVETLKDLVKADPEVQSAIKHLGLLTDSVTELRIRKEGISLQLDGLDETIKMLESIGRNEGLRKKIKYGLTKVVVEEQLGERN